jgi:hypothetical protein
MGIKDVFNQAPSIEEEALYKQVLDEVESGVMRKGIYAKALADGLGDVGKAQSLYIKYRVQSLADEEKQRAQFLIDEIKAREAEIEEEKRLEELVKTNFDTPHLKWSSPLGIIVLITSVTIIIVFAATNQFNI